MTAAPAALAALLPTPGAVILTGAYGSGKTECAMALALALAAAGPVTLVDLDVVTPYFRALDHRAALAARGVRVVAPDGRLAHNDAPALPPAAAAALIHPRGRTIADLGGDPAGAVVLAQFASRLSACARWAVVNFARPTTATLDAAAALLAQVAAATRLPLTGLVSNTHLGAETTPADLADGLARCRALGDSLGVPVVLQCAPAGCAAPAGPPLLAITPRLRRPWE
ncbi:MAG TPA: hypothetical protein PLZ36_01085 [Armatimonadota bacterium]|nr:hypothetical protein [Armatimonadota bacterium]HOS42722.1 hypothetical protein [Armatimonadota bacterium]